jgi:DNA-binding MarR family transcriptional regulator
MSTTTPTFDAPILGQTEKALNAILARELVGTGLTEPQWVTLRIIVMSGGPVEHDQLVGRVAGALKVSEAEARARIAELAAAQLVEASENGAGTSVQLANAGQKLHSRIRVAVTQITKRMWGDLPADDLATAGRVLSTVLERANAELGGARG